MDHLFCSCVCHALILVPASLRDLHRHSCRHFHFSFLAFFAPSYPHFVSQWISFLSSPPSRARAPLYILCLLALFSFLHVLPFFLLLFLSSWSAHFLFSRHSGICALVSDTEREPSLALRFSARVLRPCALFEASPPARRWGREKEKISSRPRRGRSMSFREIERSGEKRTARRNVKFRELIRSIESVSEVTRRALSKARPPPFSLNWQKSICLLPRKLGHQPRVLIKTG